MRVGPYEVSDIIGKGGSGFVARATGPDGRVVAIKLLRGGSAAAAASSADDARRQGRFERERRLGATLGAAEGFVPVLDQGESPYGSYFVMPLMGGGTLRERMGRGSLSLEQAVAVVREIARALGHAHALGIVHRDLKPENVLFSDEGKPLVADLGLAKHWDREAPGASASRSLTQPGAICGTLGYMAPEQIDSVRTVGPAADVFSLGALLYECIAGRPAFDAITLVELAALYESGAYERIESVKPDVPPAIARAIGRALDREATARFADGSAFASALDPGTDTPSPAEAAPPRGPLVLSLSIALAFAVIVAGASIAHALFRKPEPRPTPAPSAPATPTPAPAPIVLLEGHELPKGARLTPEASWGSHERRHRDMVVTVAIDPEEKLVASTCLDGTIGLWDLATGAAVRTIRASKGEVHDACFLHGGRQIVSSGTDGFLRVWETATGALVREVKVPRSYLYTVTPLKDETKVVTSSLDGHVDVIDLETGQCLRTISRNKGAVYGLAVSPSGRTVLAGGEDGTARLFELATGEEVRVFNHTPPAGAVAFSPDGSLIATGGIDRAVHIWDATSGQEVRALIGHGDNLPRPTDDGRVNALAFTADGKRLVSASFDSTVRVWDVASGECLRRCEGHWSWASCLAITRDGRRAVSGGNDQTVRIWDLDTGREAVPLAGHPSTVQALAFAPDGKTAITGSLDGTVKVWDVSSGRELSSSLVSPTALAVALSLKGPGFGLASGGTAVHVLDRSGKELRTFAERRGVGALATSLDGRTVTGGTDGRIASWDVPDSNERQASFGLGEEVTAVAISRDGKLAVAGGEAGAIRAWDLEGSGAPLEAFYGNNGAVLAVAFTEQNTRILAAARTALPDGKLTREATIRLYRASDGHELRKLDLPLDTRAVALSPAGDLAALVTGDLQLALVELGTGREVDRLDLTPCSDAVMTATFAPDGRSLLVGLRRGVVLLYSVRPD